VNGESPTQARDTNFERVSIKIASPEVIRSWSRGEVKNPETINYRTFKPEKGGLFCERIFGPTKDWECNCGKYKRIKYKGIVCDRCGVEVTQSKVRRDRMGHIELAVPVAHIWFFKTMPSRMGAILGTTTRLIERVLYYEDYIVIDPGETKLDRKELLSETEYQTALEEYGKDAFSAKMGAEAIKDLLVTEDMDALIETIQAKLAKTKSKQSKIKYSKQLKIINGFLNSGIKPEWMILECVPVIPPELRPLVPLDGGRFATSDLNDLYRRVINRNNRLKSILELKTPEVIIRNEKRMLQEAVDALFDNGRHGRPVMGAGNRPLKSLADMLKGKQGRFRQNLLGKRVDYSGRSVIVVGPELKLNQCGLPKQMALELFEPFIIRRLKEKELVYTIRSAKKMIERRDPEVWDILDEIVHSGHPVMLNRAPTLHRLGIQAFEPILVEGKAIRLHPLVCPAFNADFDGDQMAVHIPLSVEAQMEARLLMLSTNNILLPSNGKPVAAPTQDISLGCYYLTKEEPSPEGHKPRLMGDKDEAIMAFDLGSVSIHEKVKVKINGEPIVTTPGRIIFNEIIPDEIGFINKQVTKKYLNDLVLKCYHVVGLERTVVLLDALKETGFHYATLSGLSISMDDMIIPDQKGALLDEARKQVDEVELHYRSGAVTSRERYNKIIDIWTHTTDNISDAMYEELRHNMGSGDLNPVFAMIDSGSRGSKQQIRQIAGMRGLMAKPSGEIIESPITANFKEGLSVLEYFISKHGARKGLADTALKTADSGYLTRRLVDVAQDVIVNEEDCGTLNGITITSIEEGGDVIVPFRERIIGRVAADDIMNPATKEIIVEANSEIDETVAEEIEKVDIRHVKIRSVLTCEASQGICAMCYGRNFSNGKIVGLGEAVGIIAAQSIGEPGTQLTMRTFHIGGAIQQVFKQPQIEARSAGRLQYHDLRTVKNDEDKFVVLNKNGFVSVNNAEGRELEKYSLDIGSVVELPDESKVKKGQLLATWDPYNLSIYSEQSGVVKLHDVIKDVTVHEELDETTGLTRLVVVEHKEDMHPQVLIQKPGSDEVVGYYSIPAGAHISVEEKQKISGGSLLAKIPRTISKVKDITGGLPRVAELFEARKPKDAAEIAKIDGIVEFHGTAKGKRRIVVSDEKAGMAEEHMIPLGKHLTVFNGVQVRKGDQLTEGPIIPHEILEVCGPRELQEYLVNQVQEVYRLQGVEINDKHIEIIIRQMLKKVTIVDPGGTDFLYGEAIDKIKFAEANQKAVAEDLRPAEAAPLFQGITKASLGTESFISAASFQDTTRVLTDAAATGRVDTLKGFKENVIMGHVIPAGTGFETYKNISLKKQNILGDLNDDVDEAEEEQEEKVEIKV
jgi:DNA-directed RNA polymerase subunit beta'